MIVNQEYNKENFTNMTVGMEQVTTNYLISEQRTCDNWAHYINNKKMTMEEARDYLAIAQTILTNSAHIVSYKNGSYKGLSNRPHASDPNDFSVTYDGIDIFTEHILISHLYGYYGIPDSKSSGFDRVCFIPPKFSWRYDKIN